MKSIIRNLSFLAIMVLLAGCFSVSPYSKMDNWVLRQNAVPRYFATYDLIYLYPSMMNNPDIRYINWTKPPLGEEIYNYSVSQTTALCGNKVRVFAPFIHQTEYNRYMEILKGDKLGKHPELKPGIKDTVAALDWYFKHYHKKSRPFIIVGQGQGALILYEAMKRCKKINPKNGFVAAYFTGLPRKTMEQINKDFKRRGIYAGVNEYDTGVILSWNAQSQFDPKSLFTTPDGYVINPITWRIDCQEATALQDAGSAFYDFEAPKITLRTKTFKNLCDAHVEADRGVLIYNDEQVRQMFPEAKMDEGTFRGNLYSLFLPNILVNADKRVQQYLHKLQWNRQGEPASN